MSLQVWDLWIPDAAATGVPFARGRLDATDVLLVHSAPHLLTVQVRDDQGSLLASAQDLKRSRQIPMTRLRREGGAVMREEIWPDPSDYGTPVLLPGGEVGLLREWWHRDDHREWRWSLEFYNRID